jgi:mono/diheme cytochrome c family protein
MSRFALTLVSILTFVAALFIASLGAQQNPDGWQIPDTAKTQKSPLSSSPDVLKKGKSLFESKCQRCHGPEGKGNGPDADPEHKPDDLSDSSRASRNPDGVMFYKIWNGRKDPKMPALKTDLSQEEVWAIVAYAKTLRK